MLLKNKFLWCLGEGLDNQGAGSVRARAGVVVSLRPGTSHDGDGPELRFPSQGPSGVCEVGGQAVDGPLSGGLRVVSLAFTCAHSDCNTLHPLTAERCCTHAVHIHLQSVTPQLF